MTYVLGAAPAAGAPFRKQYTVQGDGWASLAKAYGYADGGTAIMNAQLADPQAKAIMASGGRITSGGVQRWMKSLPGWTESARFPFVAGNNPGTVGRDGKPEGWAFFTAQTQILLPDMPRLDGRSPAVTTVEKPVVPPVVSEPIVEAGISPFMVVGGLLLLGLALFPSKKSGKSAASSGSTGGITRWSK